MTPKLRAPKGEVPRDHALKGEQAFQGGKAQRRRETPRGGEANSAARGKAALTALAPQPGGVHRKCEHAAEPQNPGAPEAAAERPLGCLPQGGPQQQQLTAGAGRRALAGRERAPRARSRGLLMPFGKA